MEDIPNRLFAPPRTTYIITELGCIYKMLLYEGEIKSMIIVIENHSFT